jgi:hypothetical protein
MRMAQLNLRDATKRSLLRMRTAAASPEGPS